MALSPTSSRGSSLPSQWAVDAPTGGLTIRATGVAGDGDYTNLLTIYNSDGHETAYLDSSGDIVNFCRASDTGFGVLMSALAVAGDVVLGVSDGVHYPWWIAGDKTEVAYTAATPADGSIDAGYMKSYYDATNGAAKHTRKAKTADGTVVTVVTPMAPAITSGALPTATLVSGTGAQIALNRDARTVTPVTFNPTGAATATCLVQLSPDNVTYSTLVTKTFPVSVTLAGSIDEVSVIVPAGWYLKLTATNAALGTTTYY